MLRMDQVHVVRHKVLVEGRTQRAVARELGLARVTVRKYVEQAAPTRKAEAGPRARPVWDVVGPGCRRSWLIQCGGRAASSG